MSIIHDCVEVDVPVRTAYNQWTQFEEFPRFMEGVESVTQLDETHLLWVASIGGAHREWCAQIDEQEPDRRVAWHATDGTKNSGVVNFRSIDNERTMVDVELCFEPEGFTEAAGDKLGFVRRRAHSDLERFKDFIEDRRVETGAWRGAV